MTMVKQLAGMFAVVGLVACGGGKKGETTTPAEESEVAAEEPQVAEDSDMVPMEKMDEIQRLLERKQPIVARCLASAIDAKELPKNSRGKMTLAIVISEAGKADDVKVVNKRLESAVLETCVIDHVKAIQFPTLPKRYPTSYTYAFEAM